jgi:hypothetical protein
MASVRAAVMACSDGRDGFSDGFSDCFAIV